MWEREIEGKRKYEGRWKCVEIRLCERRDELLMKIDE